MKNWFKIDEKIRFIITGIFNMFLRYVIFVFLGIGLGTSHYQLVLLASWLLSSVVAFLSYKHLVFQTEGNHIKEFIKSVLIWIVSYFINAALLMLLVGYFALNTYLAQGMAIILIVVINYTLFKYFAFKQRKKTWLERLYNLWD